MRAAVVNVGSGPENVAIDVGGPAVFDGVGAVLGSGWDFAGSALCGVEPDGFDVVDSCWTAWDVLYEVKSILIIWCVGLTS